MKRKKKYLIFCIVILLIFSGITIQFLLTSNMTKSEKKEEVHGNITLNVPFVFWTSIPEDFEKVGKEFDRLTEEELGIHVNLIGILSSAKNATVTMMRNEGISFDVFPNILGAPFSDHENLLPLDELLKTNGKGILELFSEEELSLGKIDGKILKLPNKGDVAESSCVVIRKDILEKCGITKKASSIEELDKILNQISNLELEMAFIAPSRPDRSFLNRYYTWLPVGSAGLCLMNYGDDHSPQILYKTEEYKNLVTFFYKWKQNGWLPDQCFLQDIPSSDLVKNQELLGYFCHYKPGVDTQESMKCGYDMEAWILTKPFLTSADKTTCSWSISRFCEYPKEAMELLNFMYTSQEAMNLLNYGVEGENYQIDERGNAIPIDKEKTYYSSVGWEVPNQYLCLPWGKDSADIWQKTQEFNDIAYRSDNLGFQFDGTSCKNELSAMQKVIDQYAFGLETGNLEPQKYLPEFLEALYDAGMEKVEKEAQQQYKRWRKENEYIGSR
ncbi:MAG: ABC transporter substrate-binding protein [Eubacteriales bacterium]|nr:ABC transporter substrate-binding protein [Eubacteriales bacterium]